LFIYVSIISNQKELDEYITSVRVDIEKNNEEKQENHP
jgi:hypothetical protein